MAPRMSESDGPEDVWARAHGHELVGLPDAEAEARVTDAGFRAYVFRTEGGRALAAMKVRNTVTLLSREGIIHGVWS